VGLTSSAADLLSIDVVILDLLNKKYLVTKPFGRFILFIGVLFNLLPLFLKNQFVNKGFLF
tara:strand:- start:68 stop:250 length:183 start_codon:yes stop_codon:yes gene_type:complete